MILLTTTSAPSKIWLTIGHHLSNRPVSDTENGATGFVTAADWNRRIVLVAVWWLSPNDRLPLNRADFCPTAAPLPCLEIVSGGNRVLSGGKRVLGYTGVIFPLQAREARRASLMRVWH